jgi:hypothetical protein
MTEFSALLDLPMYVHMLKSFFFFQIPKTEMWSFPAKWHTTPLQQIWVSLNEKFPVFWMGKGELPILRYLTSLMPFFLWEYISAAVLKVFGHTDSFETLKRQHCNTFGSHNIRNIGICLSPSHPLHHMRWTCKTLLMPFMCHIFI